MYVVYIQFACAHSRMFVQQWFNIIVRRSVLIE